MCVALTTNELFINLCNVHGVLQCRGQPEPALYNGGILKYGNSDDPTGYHTTETGVLSPAFVVYNLNKTTMYTFSSELRLYPPSFFSKKTTVV